ncbi:retrovirus-related pol polyprotein from transposon TNT 1-94 [Tanacetum coccineum]
MVKPVWNNAQRVNHQNFAKKTYPYAKKNLVPRTGNPQMDLQDQGVIDSGCSRYMTGNMSYLTDYEEIDGGYVAFGGNPKGGKITGKDDSRFPWVFFLATKDETSGILKSFITGIENLVDHKVKVIRCDNGTEFKNKEMNQFCEMNDHLGKFDGKADEGFFVGYSLNSKAFRVFNSRTRIVEENLHIRFSESTPNVIGSGPDWLFDIDALTRTMNYKPIVVDPKSSQDDGSKPSSDDEKKVDEDPRKDSESIDQEKDDNVNSTNNVNAASTNEVNVVGGKTSIELPDDPNMPALEDISIFDLSRDNEDVGAEADMNNLDTTIQVSPIPTTRIHKDHPLNQVIGDLQSATQTRNMSKNLEEHGKNPKRNKKNERGIVIRNKARLVAQGYTQEEGIDYDEFFPLVARIEAIRLFLAYASFKDFVVYQMNVKSAFLYGKIEEEVYKGDILLVQVYMDDIIFGLTKKELCFEFEKLVHEKFQMSSMGELTFFLGLQVQQKKDGIFISQDKYVGEILKKFGFTEVKTASTQMETQKPLLKDEDGEEVDVHMYSFVLSFRTASSDLVTLLHFLFTSFHHSESIDTTESIQTYGFVKAF